MWSNTCAASPAGIEGGRRSSRATRRAASGSMHDIFSEAPVSYFFAYFTEQPYGFDVFVSTVLPAIAASRQAAT